jgi:hypothetical protein
MEESWLGSAKPPWHRHLPSERPQRVDRSHTLSIALPLGEWPDSTELPPLV